MANLTKQDGGQTAMQSSEWDPWLTPTFDVTENKDTYVVKANVPGVKQDDLEITTTGNRIVIAGKRDVEQENESNRVYTYERQYGSFSKSFTLPDSADIANAKTSFEAGVLTLTVPKHAAAQPKKIEVKASGEKP